MRKSIITNIISKILLIAMVLVILFNEVNVDAAVKVTKKNDKVYVTGTVNVRSNYTSTSKKLGVLKRGNIVKRIGVTNNGWTKIVYKNKKGFVSSKFISVKKPSKKTTNKATTPTTSVTASKATPTPAPLPSNMIDPKHFASNNSRLDGVVLSVDKNTIVSYEQYLGVINKHRFSDADKFLWSEECYNLAVQYACGDIPWTDQYKIVEISSISEKYPVDQLMESFYSSITDNSQKVYKEVGIACISYVLKGDVRCKRVICIAK